MRPLLHPIMSARCRAAFVALLLTAASGAGAQPPGGTRGMRMGMGMRHDSATMAQRSVIHELVMNHDRFTRTVTNLPNGVRTVTESSDPRLARLLREHVATMRARVEQGSDPGLPMESPALRTLFRNHDKIAMRVDTTQSGLVVVQTSDDAETVAALQKHAAEVSELVHDGPAAMRRAMMASGRGMMRGGMGGMMNGRPTPAAPPPRP